MGLPVWVSVLAGCVVGGFIAGTVTGFMSSGSPLVGTFLPVLVAGIAAGVATSALLPRISGRYVGMGTAVLAGISGAMAGLIISRVLGGRSASVYSHVGATSSLISTAASIVLMSWMVGSSAKVGSQWRGSAPSWSDIEKTNRAGTGLQQDQAEHGYWGSMEDHDQPDPS